MNLQTSPSRFRFGFIGAGKLAGSVVRGLLQVDFCGKHEIIASEPQAEARAMGAAETGITMCSDNLQVARDSEVIFIGVKPQFVLPVLQEISREIAGKLVVSFAAGVRLASMEAGAAGRFARVLTNTPSAIARGATGIAGGSAATGADLDLLLEIFGRIGVAVAIEENEIDAVTALAGSGPAFVYTMIEALAAGGIGAGLHREHALKLAAQTVRGAAELMLGSGKSPGDLRKMVVTPGGTTAAGLSAMQTGGASEAIEAAVRAAASRGEEMSREFGP